jgi:hypothetical protein
MTRTFAWHPIALVLAAAAALAGCSENPVGRICDLGLTPGESESVVASPSLDCVTRTCLRIPVQQGAMLETGVNYPTGDLGMCTAECDSDDDCDRVPESPCQNGFTCGVPVVVGPFCCRKFCICKDYVVLPDDGGDLPEPDACDANNADNACCNLAGRPGDERYPNCPG